MYLKNAAPCDRFRFAAALIVVPAFAQFGQMANQQGGQKKGQDGNFNRHVLTNQMIFQVYSGDIDFHGPPFLQVLDQFGGVHPYFRDANDSMRCIDCIDGRKKVRLQKGVQPSLSRRT